MPDTEILKIWVNVILFGHNRHLEILMSITPSMLIFKLALHITNLQIFKANKVLHPVNIQSIIAVSCFGIWYICSYASFHSDMGQDRMEWVWVY